MASFPEIVLRVRFRWQQFIKYGVPQNVFLLIVQIWRILH